MFRITGGRGFHITFENGYTVSVQFGLGNYCDNYGDIFSIGVEDFSKVSEAMGKKGSKNAECAVWKRKGSLIEHPLFDNDSVGGYMTPAQVLELLNWAASQPKE
jgi:hypothetical protein